MIHPPIFCNTVILSHFPLKIYIKTPQNQSPEELKILFEIVRSKNV